MVHLIRWPVGIRRFQPVDIGQSHTYPTTSGIAVFFNHETGQVLSVHEYDHFHAHLEAIMRHPAVAATFAEKKLRVQTSDLAPPTDHSLAALKKSIVSAKIEVAEASKMLNAVIKN